MAQLSRPFQLALIIVATLAVAWFALLRTHLTSGTGGSSGSSTPPSSAAHSSSPSKAGSVAQSEGTPTKVYHGAAPGVEGLTRDIRRAHEAVGTSEAQARKLEGSSASQASHVAHAQTSKPRTGQRAGGHTVTPSSTQAAPAIAHHRAATKSSRPTSSHRAAMKSSPATSSHHASPGAAHRTSSQHASDTHHVSRAVLVGDQLKAGKVVLLLFWSKASPEDQGVRAQVQAASRSLKGRVATDYAKPSEVGAFGAVTRDVTVLQTPTLLVINRKGLVTTIAGLTDTFSIEQAVREAGG